MARERISGLHRRRLRDHRVQAALVHLRSALVDLYGQDAPTAILYGSHARGEAGVTSDVDVLLVYPRSIRRGQEIRQLGPILADLNLRYEVVVSVLPSDQVEYASAIGPFWSNVRREGINLDAI